MHLNDFKQKTPAELVAMAEELGGGFLLEVVQMHFGKLLRYGFRAGKLGMSGKIGVLEIPHGRQGND